MAHLTLSTHWIFRGLGAVFNRPQKIAKEAPSSNEEDASIQAIDTLGSGWGEAALFNSHLCEQAYFVSQMMETFPDRF